MTDELIPGLSVHFMVKNPPLARFAALVMFLYPLVDEIVIVDTGSSPEDVALMRAWNYNGDQKVIVIEEPFVNFAVTRNVGLRTHRYEWTLGLDPDELPSFSMMKHILHAVSAEGMNEFPRAAGWCYWTYNWWHGTLGPEMDYHRHTRLWKTKGSYLERPVHELVVVAGKKELSVRNTTYLPFAPKDAYLIHSKDGEAMTEADELYKTLGEVSH